MLLWTLALLIPCAHAADGDGFTPSGSLVQGDGTLQGEGARITKKGLSLALFGTLGDDTVRDGDEPLLSTAFATTLYGGWTFSERVRVEAFVPFYPWVEAPANDFTGPAFGDIRLQTNVRLFEPAEGHALAVVPMVGLPTGSGNALVAQGFHAGLTAVASGEFTFGFGYTVNVGLTVSPSSQLTTDLASGSTFQALGGAWYRFSPQFRVGGEVQWRSSLVDPALDYGNGHLFAQVHHPSGLHLTGGAGGSFLPEAGPDFRWFAAIGWSLPELDRDDDTILDPDDACVLDPEDLDGFEDTDGCPEDDNDEDGILDVDDSCPMDPEDFDDFEDTDGCPEEDNDQDGILDADDACPVVWGLPEFDGCPDTDEDGIADAEDACPTEPGPIETQGCPDRDLDLVPDFRDKCPDEPRPIDEDPETSDGCPKLVYIAGDQVRIREKVLFELGKAVVRTASYGLLDDVARTVVAHPEFKTIEVAGHTDDTGSDALNQRLSEARANAVMQVLIRAGVPEDRLIAKGYGETTPIDTNRTAEGRENNRRVEFHIRERGEIIMDKTEAIESGAEILGIVPEDEVPADMAPEEAAPEEAAPVEEPPADEAQIDELWQDKPAESSSPTEASEDNPWGVPEDAPTQDDDDPWR